MNDEPQYGIVPTSMFKKDLKLVKKRGYDLSLLDKVIDTLAKGQPLDEKYGKPLFQDTFEAWEHGPVIPGVYAKYKEYGDEPIKEYDADDIPDMPKDVDDILFGGARKYGVLTASALRNKTHVIGSPWSQVYKRGQLHTEIPTQMIQDYFSGLEEVGPVKKSFKESDFVGYRDNEGYLVLPKEWSDDGEV